MEEERKRKRSEWRQITRTSIEEFASQSFVIAEHSVLCGRVSARRCCRHQPGHRRRNCDVTFQLILQPVLHDNACERDRSEYVNVERALVDFQLADENELVVWCENCDTTCLQRDRLDSGQHC